MKFSTLFIVNVNDIDKELKKYNVGFSFFDCFPLEIPSEETGPILKELYLKNETYTAASSEKVLKRNIIREVLRYSLGDNVPAILVEVW